MKIDIEENLLILMIDAALKINQAAINSDNKKNANHSDNLHKIHSDLIALLESIQ